MNTHTRACACMLYMFDTYGAAAWPPPGLRSDGQSRPKLRWEGTFSSAATKFFQQLVLAFKVPLTLTISCAHHPHCLERLSWGDSQAVHTTSIQFTHCLETPHTHHPKSRGRTLPKPHRPASRYLRSSVSHAELCEMARPSSLAFNRQATQL